MNIRQKLTLLFLLLSFAILAVCFLVIFYTQSAFREEQFRERMEVKARSIENSFSEHGAFSIEQLSRIRRASAQLYKEQIFIMDASGLLLFSAPQKPRIIPDTSFLAVVNSKTVHFFDWQEFECFSMLTVENPSGIRIVVAGYDQYGHNKINRLKELLSLLLAIGLLASSLVGWFYAGSALSPINRIISQVDKISAGSLDARLEEGNKKDELARLSMTFNRMLNRIEEAFEAQKNFVANASHELRTPLTIISGRLELALIRDQSQGREHGETHQAIEEVLGDIRQLSQICTSLLVLAQSHSKRDQLSFSQLRIDELVWQVRSDFLKMNPAASIEVQFITDPEEDTDLTAFGNEQLLRTAFINLIDNACKFSSNNAMNIGIQFDKTSITLEFSDEGPGIDSDDLSRLMQPFFRGRQGVGRIGFGLGLPMVDNIVKLHGGTLEIRSQKGVGSTFCLKLPKRQPSNN